MVFDIKELQRNISNLKVAVIGDYCLDQYWYMDSKFDKKLDYNDNITFALTDIVYSPGGAGNVANNFVKLGAAVKCVGLIGDDGYGYQLMQCLKNINADAENMIITNEKETHTCIRPSRIIDNQNITLNEIITSKFKCTGKQVEDAVKKVLSKVIAEADAVVLVEQFEDNNKGIFTDTIRAELSKLSKENPNKIFIIDSRKYISEYTSMYLKCNQYEFFDSLNNAGFNSSCIIELSKNLKDFKALFITSGENGMTLIYNNSYAEHVPAIKAQQEVNTCGAGDSATVGIVLGLYSKYSEKKAALLGNIMASITIKDLEATGYPTYEKLAEALRTNSLLYN